MIWNKDLESRLDSWLNLRKSLTNDPNPLQTVWDYWKSAPFIPYNRKIDRYYPNSWPSPWEILADNRYDDFTKALMIAYTLKLSEKFKDLVIIIKTMIDKQDSTEYNIVYVDNTWVINYRDFGPTSVDQIPDSFRLENHIEVSGPR